MKLCIMTAQPTVDAVIAYKDSYDGNVYIAEKMGVHVTGKKSSAFYGDLDRNEQPFLSASTVTIELQKNFLSVADNFTSFNIKDVRF